MVFINNNLIEDIKKIKAERAKDFYYKMYNLGELFNNAKEILLLCSVKKDSWESIMKLILAKSLNCKEYIASSKQLNLLGLIYENLILTGEIIDIEDLLNIAYTYVDYCPNHPEVITDTHFGIQNIVLYLYKNSLFRVELEKLCLSDFVVLRMCPEELMKACIPTIETCIKLAKKDGDPKSAECIANYAMDLLNEDSSTYQYCKRFLERLK